MQAVDAHVLFIWLFECNCKELEAYTSIMLYRFIYIGWQCTGYVVGALMHLLVVAKVSRGERAACGGGTSIGSVVKKTLFILWAPGNHSAHAWMGGLRRWRLVVKTLRLHVRVCLVMFASYSYVIRVCEMRWIMCRYCFVCAMMMGHRHPCTPTVSRGRVHSTAKTARFYLNSHLI